MYRTNKLVAATAALMLATSLVACGGGSSTQAEPTPEPATQEQTTEQTTQETTSSDQANAAESQQTSGTSAQATDTKRVGKEGVGFVTIPSDWVSFKDVEGGTDVQFSSPDTSCIITLNTFDMSTVPEDQRATFDAMAAANAVGNNIAADEGVEDVQGATVTLAGRTAYQIYAAYSDGSFLVTWSLADDDGVIHYVAAEGPSDSIMDVVEMVEGSYSFTE